MSVVNALADAFYPTRFLELSTPKTGHLFEELRFDLCARADLAKYRTPCSSQTESGREAGCAAFHDAWPNSDRLLDEILVRLGDQPKYDVALCDPHHSYANSLGDLSAAWKLLEPGGTLVVHDCSPATRELASIVQADSWWCGRTFEAFLDFVYQMGAPYFTVDADYGVGVVHKTADEGSVGHPFAPLLAAMSDTARKIWAGTSPDEDRFDLFDENRCDLLNLVPAQTFIEVMTGGIGSSPDDLAPVRGSGVESKFGSSGRTNADLQLRYEEKQRSDEHRLELLRRRNDDLEQALVVTRATADRIGADRVQVDVDLAETRNRLGLTEALVAQRSAEFVALEGRMAGLQQLLAFQSMELAALKSSTTFRLRSLALRTKLPLQAWRLAARLVERVATLVRT